MTRDCAWRRAGERFVLALTLALVGCGKTAPEPEPEAEPATSPAPVATAEPATIAEPPPEPASAVVPAEAGEDEQATATVAPKAADEGAEDNVDPIERFARALTDVERCERAADSLFVANPEACFATLKKAREALTGPAKTDPDTRERLQQRMALVLEEALGHANSTVVFYAMTGQSAHFRATPKTLARLDKLMATDEEQMAEAAARVRFGLQGADAGETKKAAIATFGGHPHRRVRHAACRHLGTPQYKGDKKVFKLLLATAKDAEEELLLRSCAAREAGHVATDRQVKTLAALLDTPELQQATIIGLQRGLATPKAIAAYVRWFEQVTSTPDKLHWTAMHAFLPWDGELDRMPRDRAINVLVAIAGHTGHQAKVRTVAVEGLNRLKAEAALEKLTKQLGPDDAPELLQMLGR